LEEEESTFKMKFEHFFESVFELAGTRCRKLKSGTYVQFIQSLYNGIFIQNMDENGKWQWRNPNSMFRHADGDFHEHHERNQILERKPSGRSAALWNRAEKYLNKTKTVRHMAKGWGDPNKYTSSLNGVSVGEYSDEVMKMADKHGKANGEISVSEMQTFLGNTDYEEVLIYLVGTGRCARGKFNCFDVNSSGSLDKGELYSAVDAYFKYKELNPEPLTFPRGHRPCWGADANVTPELVWSATKSGQLDCPTQGGNMGGVKRWSDAEIAANQKEERWNLIHPKQKMDVAWKEHPGVAELKKTDSASGVAGQAPGGLLDTHGKNMHGLGKLHDGSRAHRVMSGLTPRGLEPGEKSPQEYAEEIMAIADRIVHNGELSKNELETYLLHTEYEEFLYWCKQKGHFRGEDTDHDGQLNVEELKGAMTHFLDFKANGGVIHINQKPHHHVDHRDATAPPVQVEKHHMLPPVTTYGSNKSPSQQYYTGPIVTRSISPSLLRNELTHSPNPNPNPNWRSLPQKELTPRGIPRAVFGRQSSKAGASIRSPPRPGTSVASVRAQQPWAGPQSAQSFPPLGRGKTALPNVREHKEKRPRRRPEETKERVLSSDTRFDGLSYTVAQGQNRFDRDFTIRATIRSEYDGTIIAKCCPQGAYSVGQAAFTLVNGHLSFDVGFMGTVEGRRFVADGAWHRVAVVYSQVNECCKLYVDGFEDARRHIHQYTALEEPEGLVTRVGCGGDLSKYLAGFKGDICEPTYNPWAFSHTEINMDARGALSAQPSAAMSQPLPTVWQLPSETVEDSDQGYVRPKKPRKLVNTKRMKKNVKLKPIDQVPNQ